MPRILKKELQIAEQRWEYVGGDGSKNGSIGGIQEEKLRKKIREKQPGPKPRMKTEDPPELLDENAYPKHFGELGLKREVVEGAAHALGRDPRDHPDAPDLIVPAPVQAEAIPKILAGDQVVIAAETGSGKSLAYMLPLMQQVREKEKVRGMDYGLAYQARSPLGLVMCPTRELAMQAYRSLKMISYHAKLRVRCIYGGSGTWIKQRRETSQVVDLLVATPDRLLKFVELNDIRLNDVAHIAIDEADFMLTQGFEDAQQILKLIDERSRFAGRLKYTLICASITKPMWKILQEDDRWKNMQVLESKGLHKPQANCIHTFHITKGRDRLEMLVNLLRPEITGQIPSKQTLVFCNSVLCAKTVAYKLKEAFPVEGASKFIGELHRDMAAPDRQEVVKRFALGELKMVICTDIAQRGLDLPNCGHVVCFDFPLNSIDYLHRAGRTARFGDSGRVTSFIKKGDKALAKAIERSVQLGAPINNLSSDRRDYMRGGSLYNLIAKHPQSTARERGLPPPKETAAGLR